MSQAIDVTVSFPTRLKNIWSSQIHLSQKKTAKKNRDVVPGNSCIFFRQGNKKMKRLKYQHLQKESAAHRKYPKQPTSWCLRFSAIAKLLSKDKGCRLFFGSWKRLYGCFRKWWYPQTIQFNRDFHYKSSILGYPYVWKHPYTTIKTIDHHNLTTNPMWMVHLPTWFTYKHSHS